MESILEGIVLGLSISAPIGPTNIEMIRRGLKGGFWVCIVFAAGVEVALVIYLAAIFAGLSFLTEVEAFNLLLSAFGVIVLFYLGFTSIKDFLHQKDLNLDAPDGEKKDNHFISGIILTIANPAVLLFWSGIIGANVATRVFSLNTSLLISGGILTGATLWFLGLSALIYGGRRFITPKVFGYISALAGLVLLGFGVSFGYRILQRFL
jgi:threonine/homoserine/homoserine lactone efflux protein